MAFSKVTPGIYCSTADSEKILMLLFVEDNR